MAMTQLLPVALLLLVAGHGAGLTMRASSSANPIRKVVTLMQDMQKEIESEVENEKKLFEKFMCICQEYPSELKSTIEEASKSIEDLTGTVQSETAEKSRLALEVKGHGADKASAEKDLSQATALREKEAAAHTEESANLKASLEGLSKAIPAIEKGGAAFLQGSGPEGLEAVVQSAGGLTAWQRRTVTAWLQSTSGAGDSGEVLGILKQLADDMTKSLAEGEKSEQIALDGFNQLKSAKEEQISVAADAIESKEKRSGELALSIVQNQDALDDAEERKAASSKMLHTLTTTCGSRKLDWEAHFKTKADEVTAISETIAILNDDDALDIFKKAAPSALVQGSSTGLLQTRRAAFQALESLRLMVHRFQSREARKTSQEPVAAAAVPAEPETELEKIPGHMIEDLEKQHEDDKKKKAFCQAEITKAEGVEKAKQDALDALDATVEQVTDEIDGIAGEIAAIEKEIAGIDQSVAKATEERKAEHADFVESLSMADAAVALLAKAKNRLQKFYNPTLYRAPPKKELSMEDKIVASYASFVQRKAKQLPELPTVPKSEKKNSGGVVALIDKLSNEITMDKTESGHNEQTAQKDYVELMKEASDSRAESQKSVVEKKASKASLETRLLEAKEAKEGTFKDLTNAHEFTQTLHKTCDFLLQHFEEKTAAIESEEESLKAAKQILHEPVA